MMMMRICDNDDKHAINIRTWWWWACSRNGHDSINHYCFWEQNGISLMMMTMNDNDDDNDDDGHGSSQWASLASKKNIKRRKHRFQISNHYDYMFLWSFWMNLFLALEGYLTHIPIGSFKIFSDDSFQKYFLFKYISYRKYWVQSFQEITNGFPVQVRFSAWVLTTC